MLYFTTAPTPAPFLSVFLSGRASHWVCALWLIWNLLIAFCSLKLSFNQLRFVLQDFSTHFGLQRCLLTFFITHCRIDSFRVLRQYFCGKFEFSADFSIQLIQFFGCMCSRYQYNPIVNEEIFLHNCQNFVMFIRSCQSRAEVFVPDFNILLIGFSLNRQQWWQSVQKMVDPRQGARKPQS